MSSSLLRRRSTMESQQRALGLPVSVSCYSPEYLAQPESGYYNLTLEFDYELAVYNPNELMVEVTNQDVPFLEFAVLQMLARTIHLRPCDLPGQGLENAAVVGLSSIEPDTMDYSVPTCTHLIDIDPDWICLPFNGVMIATYTGTPEARQDVLEYLQQNIRAVIDNADKEIGRVQKAHFVGSRVRDASGTTVDANNSSSSSVALASSLAGAAVVTILVFYIVLARRRRRKDDPDTPSEIVNNSKEVVMGRDAASAAAVPAAVTTNPTEEKSEEDILCDNGDMDAEAPSNGQVDISKVGIQPAAATAMIAAPITLTAGRTASTANMDDSGSDDEHPPDQFEEELKRVENSSPNEDEFQNVTASSITVSGPTVMVDISKPPKPPTAPSNKPPVPVPASKQLKKRRKRKKRKKKPSMGKRTNSREKIDEMETIAECEEETSDNKSGSGDEDSEYSWYSTSDSEPGSRDPSPARSREASPNRSTNSSRDESPARSTSSEPDEATEKPKDRRRWV